MALVVRAIEPEELRAFAVTDGNAFGFRPSDWAIGRTGQFLELDRTAAAFEGNALVGTSGALTFETTVPGGAAVPTAGITCVGVTPTHRRRGVLTEMMRALLEQARERGEPLATLWASESIIYGRFGFGIAIEQERWEIEREHVALEYAPSSGGSIRLVEPDEAQSRVPEAWDCLRAVQPGMTSRDERFWRRRFDEHDFETGADRPFFHALYEEDGRADGYAMYRVQGDWSTGIPANIVRVVEAIAATDAAHAALWRFLFSLDLVGTIEAHNRPLDDPVTLMLADPRRLSRRRFDAIWLRFVDLERALEARRYGSPGRVVLDVRDEFCPWNPRRVALEAGEGGASARETAEAPELALETSALAMTYFGANRFAALARAGRVEERRPGALARADAMFAAERAPWCPEHF
jgi:predicted acetyltransferase